MQHGFIALCLLGADPNVSAGVAGERSNIQEPCGRAKVSHQLRRFLLLACC